MYFVDKHQMKGGCRICTGSSMGVYLRDGVAVRTGFCYSLM